MDPNHTLAQIVAAYESGNAEEAESLGTDLRLWFEVGGSPPDRLAVLDLLWKGSFTTKPFQMTPRNSPLTS